MSDNTNHGLVLPNLVFKIKKLHPDAKIPQRAHEFDAGLDLVSVQDVTITPGAVVAVGTGLALALPNGMEAQIRSRSGMALRDTVIVLNSPGTIDASYRGEVKVILMNLGKKDFSIKKGDKIAQMVLSTVLFLPNIHVVEELDSTERGEGGFGSTDV